MEKKPLSHFLVGLILGLILIICFLIFYFTGRSFEKGVVGLIPVLLFAIILIVSIVQWSKANKHNVSFGSCFSYGFKATAVATLIMAAFTLLFIFIFPDYKVKYLEFMISQMENDSNLGDDKKEKALEMMEKFFMLSVLAGTLFFNLLAGLISSLIGAAVAKKKPQTPFQA